MPYSDTQQEQLSDDLFQNPTSRYRAAPFWAWNCQLDPGELQWQLQVLKRMGMGGVHPHVRTGLATPYLGDAYFSAVRHCIRVCEQEDLLLWLYDEDRWPSGAAGGLVTKDPQYRARHLLLTPFPYGPEERPPECTRVNGTNCRSVNGTLLQCYDIELDPQGCLAYYRTVDATEPVRGRRWYAYLETAVSNPWYNGQTYVNTLDPAAIKRFLTITHEAYRARLGEYFGTRIPAVFTDEPQFTHKTRLDSPQELTDIILPWTDDLPDTFYHSCGLELLPHLPQLVWQLPDGQVSALRYHYHDHVCQRFVEAFADQCGCWCHQNGLMLTGHVMKEPTLESQTTALGEAMRCYRSFQLPGVDMLRDRMELTTVKQAQSAAHQYGRQGVLSELYGVTGWDFDFRGHKFQGDWQAALGVTVRVPHLSMMSMKGESKRDYPASIHYQSPWWQDYPCIENHFARIHTALTRGTPLVRIGVIHPIESYWLHFGPKSQTAPQCDRLDRQFGELTRWLLEGCLDFDFISEALLPDLCQQGKAPLSVGAMSYDVILVPECHTLRSTTLDRLEAFHRSGGTLIFLGNAPLYENARPSRRGEDLWSRSKQTDFSRECLLEALEPYRVLSVRSADGGEACDFLHQLRQDGQDKWLFLAHSKKPGPDDPPQDICISIPGCYYVLFYDTRSGQIHPQTASHCDGNTQVRLTLYSLDSVLLRLTPKPLPGSSAPATYTRRSLPVPSSVAYSLSEPNVLLLDQAEYALDSQPYQAKQELLRADTLLRTQLGWRLRTYTQIQPWAAAPSEISHTVRLRFCVHARQTTEPVKLALEDAALARIFLNGIPVPAEPDGWFTDKAISTVPLGTLQAGENHIEVVLPFGEQTGLEWCYLLGNFGVCRQEQHRTLTPMPHRIAFGDLVEQGFPHYGGNITYQLPVTLTGSRLGIQVPDYDGTAIRVQLQGQQAYLIEPPYSTVLESLSPGTHTLQLTLLGHRGNCFGPVHMTNTSEHGSHPRSWHTTGEQWTDGYRLNPIGIHPAALLWEEVPIDAYIGKDDI